MNDQVLNSPNTCATITVDAATLHLLVTRLTKLEQMVNEYMDKRRELAIIEMGYVEQAKGLPRSKHPTKRR